MTKSRATTPFYEWIILSILGLFPLLIDANAGGNTFPSFRSSYPHLGSQRSCTGVRGLTTALRASTFDEHGTMTSPIKNPPFLKPSWRRWSRRSSSSTTAKDVSTRENPWMPKSVARSLGSYYGGATSTTSMSRLRSPQTRQQSRYAAEDDDDDDDSIILPPTKTRSSQEFMNLFDASSEGEEEEDDGEDEREVFMKESTLRSRHSSPVVYRYFARRRFRRDSVPFVFLGPSVDHWTPVAEAIAAQGFPVFVCERQPHKSRGDSRNEEQEGDYEESGDTLISSVLDALRWERAILVGCDTETRLAIEAALELGSERVAGLILCGDLSTAESFVHEITNVNSPFAPDLYLDAALDCPFSIVWDGGEENQAFLPVDLVNHRALVFGGGSAPHRRRPDQFAWTLTRFVEEQVNPITMLKEDENDVPHFLDKDSMFGRMWASFWGPEGCLVVPGRILAYTLLCGSILKMIFFQYSSIQGFLLNFFDIMSSPSKIIGALAGLAGAIGSWFRFGGSKRSSDEAFRSVDELTVEVIDMEVDDGDDLLSTHKDEKDDDIPVDSLTPKAMEVAEPVRTKNDATSSSVEHEPRRNATTTDEIPRSAIDDGFQMKVPQWLAHDRIYT